MWLKPLAVFSGKLRECRLHFRRAAITGVFQRPAAKRSEAGAENDAGIELVGVADDALVQARHSFINHWQHQAILQIAR